MTPLTYASPSFFSSSKRVLVRTDYNVPLQNGQILEPMRIDATLETLAFLKNNGAKVVLISHLGRPQGVSAGLSLAPIADYLGQKLGAPIPLISGAPESWLMESAWLFQDHDVVMLENIRFFPQEEKDDAHFAAQLAALGEVYVNDAFSVSHRAHASVHALPLQMKHRFSGMLLTRELEMASSLMQGDAKQKRLAVIGGSKISTKIGVLEALLPKVQHLAVVGAMANTFLKARGFEAGTSLVEDAWLAKAAQLEGQWSEKLWIPDEVVVLLPDGTHRTQAAAAISKEACILDMAPHALQQLAALATHADLVFWNGPLGRIETPPFDEGSREFARFLASQTRLGKLQTIVGGGETAAVVAAAGVVGDLTYVSLAGGALLEWIEGRELPGLKVLNA